MSSKKKAAKQSAAKAPAKASKKAQAFHTRKGALGEIFGFSATSVLRALGKAGVTCKHARAIMKEKGIKISDKSCDTQVSFGRCNTRTPAPITPTQLTELRECAPDPDLAAAV